MWKRLWAGGCFTLVLLFVGCSGDTSMSLVADIFNVWNEYCDVASLIESEQDAAYYFKNKLVRLKDRWELMDMRRKDLAALDPKLKKTFHTNMARWNVEGKATMQRLIFVAGDPVSGKKGKLQKIIDAEVEREQERRTAKGDASPIVPDTLCPYLTSSIKLRDTFYISFTDTRVKDAPQLEWNFPAAAKK